MAQSAAQRIIRVGKVARGLLLRKIWHTLRRAKGWAGLYPEKSVN